MRLKIRPPFPACLPDFKLDSWTLKTPPCPPEAAPGVENPVRGQPVDNVIVTRKKDHLPAGTPPGFCKSRRPDFCNLPVDNACKFVHHGAGRGLADKPGKRGAEFLAGRKHMKGPQPCGHVTEPHGGKRRGHGLPVSALGVRRYGVNNGSVSGPAFRAAQGVLAPYPRPQAGLAGAGRPHHKPDLPRFGFRAVYGQVGFKVKAYAFHIEKTLHARGAVGIESWGGVMNANFHTRTTLHL